MAAWGNDAITYFTRVAEINRQLDAHLRGSVPSALRPEVERIAAAWDQMASLYDQAAAAARKGDRSQALDYSGRAEEANQFGNDLAVKIGLRDCAAAGGIGVASGSPLASI
jgi:hypothetical protein